MKSIGLSAIYFAFFIFISGCSSDGGGGGSSTGSTNLPSVSSSTESDYCSTVQTFQNFVTVTGQATYEPRNLNSSSNLGPSTSINPIRHAEVIVSDSSGTTVQCGETDDTGAFSLQLPRTNATYTLKVNSRSNNSYLQASVLKDPASNQYYSLSASISTTSTQDVVAVPTLDAYYKCPSTNTSCDLESAAFNILDQLYNANAYIRSHSSCAVCSAFSVAPKLRVFWKRGFNPATYYPEIYGSNPQGVSFYLAGTDVDSRKLFILGGSDGLTDNVDTDHFDNSVIVHEYGHFLENVFGKTDSPGGTHIGNYVIDPRLSWSEGWADFLQGAVQSSQYYIDTAGNTDGTVLPTIKVNFATQTQDVPQYTSEGAYREFAVARSLWDTISAPATPSVAAQTANIPFAYVWNSVKSFSDNTLHFRNASLFYSLLRPIVSTNLSASYATALDSVLTYEKITASPNAFARTLASTGSSCSSGVNITGAPDLSSNAIAISCNPSDSSLGQSCPTTDLLRANHFYDYYYDGVSPFTISLDYTQSGSNMTYANDLDLYIYKESYVYMRTSTLAGSSAHAFPENSSAPTLGHEQVTITGASAGHYLINVRVNVAHWGNNTYTANYKLSNAQGVNICQ